MKNTLYKHYIMDVEIIDKQHKRFFELFDNLHNAFRYNKEEMDNFIIKFMEDMKHFISDHFETERALMLNTGYPNMTEHMKEHATMSGYLFDLITEYYIKDKFNPIEVYKYMEKYIIAHIGKSDKEFFDYYKEYKNTLGFKIKEMSFINKKASNKNGAKI